MSKFTSGALWVTLTSTIGMVASYLNTLLASNIGDSASTLSFYALVLLLVQTVSTFGILGGSSAFSQNLPALSSQVEKDKFFTSIFAVSVLLISLISLIFVISPDYLIDIGNVNRGLLFLFIIIVFFQQFFLFILPAICEYRSYAIFIALMPISICLYLSFIYFTNNLDDVESGIVVASFTSLFISLCLSAKTVFKKVNFMPMKFKEIVFFSKKALSVHLVTLISFLYFALDQYLITFLLGTGALATYFLSLQISQLVRFVPLKLGQLFLSSFSGAIKSNDTSQLYKMYNKSSFVLVFLANLVVIASLCYLGDIKKVFGAVGQGSGNLIFYMCFIMAVGAMGPINSMLVLAFQRNSSFLKVNILVLIVSLLCFLMFFESLGIVAIFLAKLISMIVGQLGNWIIIYKVWGRLPKNVIINYFFGILYLVVGYLFIGDYNSGVMFAALVLLNLITSLFFYLRVKSEIN